MADEFGKALLAEYSAELAMKHVSVLAGFGEKAPGTEAENKACGYITRTLESYGLQVEVQEFDCFTGYRGEGKLTVLSPCEKEIRSVVQGFSGSTTLEGLEAELVYITDVRKELVTTDVKGKLVLLDGAGLGQVDRALLVEAAGAIGQIYTTPIEQDVILCVQNRSTWGNPIVDNIHDYPRTPIVNITQRDAELLKQLLKSSRVTLRITAQAFVGWKRAKQPIATLHGNDRKKHVMVTSHFCSWWDGAIDNCAAVAVNLELARAFAERKKALARTIKFAFWSGHTHATFAGSTYYVDTNWEDIDANMVAEFNVESPGAKDSSCPPYMTFGQAEFRRMHIESIRQVTRLEPGSKDLVIGRAPKIGDSSFWGIGVPRVAFDMLKEPFDIWFWHTKEDTVDKVDMAVARWIYGTYALSILKLVNSKVIPADFTAVAEEYEHALREITNLGPPIDLRKLMMKATRFRSEARRLNSKARTAGRVRAQKINECLMRLSRITMPPLYQKEGRYTHERLGRVKNTLPGLRPKAKAEDDEQRKLEATSMRRSSNMVDEALDEAIELIRRTLQS